MACSLWPWLALVYAVVAAAETSQGSQQGLTAHALQSMCAVRFSAGDDPPVARRNYTKTSTNFNDTRSDYYDWLRQPQDASGGGIGNDVLSYLQQENDYSESVLNHLTGLRKSLQAELQARGDRSKPQPPYFQGGYWYYEKDGKRFYAIYRRKVSVGSASHFSETDAMDPRVKEELVLDLDEECTGRTFCDPWGIKVSPDGVWVAFGLDEVGDERYALQVRNVADRLTKRMRPAETAGEYAWSSDSYWLLYTTKSLPDQRATKLWTMALPTSFAGPRVYPKLLYEETDPAFRLDLSTTHSGHHIVLHARDEVTQDARVLDSMKPDQGWQLVAPREPEVQYTVSEWGSKFLLLVKSPQQPNGELRVAHAHDVQTTQVLIAHRQDVVLVSVLAFVRHLVLEERRGMRSLITIYPLPDDGSLPDKLTGGWQMGFAEASYELTVDVRHGPYWASVLRLHYSSLKTPDVIMDINMATRNNVTKWERFVPGYCYDQYTSELLWVPVADGTVVPVSLIFNHKLMRKDGSNPLLLEGYGAYGSSFAPSFSADRISLLDRGVVFAIAHVRGGGELGRAWYDAGRRMNKLNTFTDFVAVAEKLVEMGYTNSSRVAFHGRSAGGLTVAAALNMRPGLAAAAVLEVPFVDMLGALLDPSMPLTVPEWEEWGDPLHDEAAYRYIKGYSPFDNIRGQAYPHLLVTAGLRDTRVPYWGPAKYVASLRRAKAGDGLLLLRTDMGSGHFGGIDIPTMYAFLLTALDACTLRSAGGNHDRCVACVAVPVALSVAAVLAAGGWVAWVYRQQVWAVLPRPLRRLLRQLLKRIYPEEDVLQAIELEAWDDEPDAAHYAPLANGAGRA